MTTDWPPQVSLIIPVRNGEATLGDCLASLLKTDYPKERREILVVDNGSTDRSLAIARRFPVRCIQEPKRGAVHARNRGIEHSTAGIVAFTDADCVVTTGWLVELMRPFASPAVAATTGELMAFPPATAAERYIAKRKPRWQEWASSGEVPWFLIGNTAIRRAVFDRIGMLDPAFAVVGCEDIDFSLRFFDAGLHLQRCPRAIALHKHRPTARSLFAQQFRNGRGHSLLHRKHRSVPWGAGRELAAWWDLTAHASRLALGRPGAGGDGRPDRTYAYYDLIRKLAQRAGFAHGTIRLTLSDLWARPK